MPTGNSIPPPLPATQSTERFTIDDVVDDVVGDVTDAAVHAVGAVVAQEAGEQDEEEDEDDEEHANEEVEDAAGCGEGEEGLMKELRGGAEVGVRGPEARAALRVAAKEEEGVVVEEE